MATIKNNAANAATENTVKTEGTENVQVSNPMMKQFKQLKEKRPDALLLFRCGDFYECYEDDAKAVAEVLGITLTKGDDGTTMAGFPHHALDKYLPMLVRAGKRVAICDQITPSNSPSGEQKTNDNANDNPNGNDNDNANDNKKPKSEKPKSEKPKTTKPKTEKPKAKANDNSQLSTLHSCMRPTRTRRARPVPVSRVSAEDDARYLQGPELHGSKTWERDKKGNKTYMLVFGPVYVNAAKQLCEAWNNGDAAAISKAVEAVNGTLDAHRKEREAQRAEYKAKKAANTTTKSEGCYTKEDVAAMLQKVMAGEDIPEEIKRLLSKAA